MLYPSRSNFTCKDKKIKYILIFVSLFADLVVFIKKDNQLTYAFNVTTGLLLSVALNTKMMSFIYNNKNNIQTIGYGDTYVQFVYDEKDRVASFFVRNDVDEMSQNSWCVALLYLK